MKSFEITLNKYLEIFLNQEMYFTEDIRCLDFFKAHPTNTDAMDIRTKISAINDREVHEGEFANDLVGHIQKLNIDSRLQKKDLSVVEEIAHLNVRGKSFHLLAFASLYCSLHHPTVFPVYSEQHFQFYKTWIVQRKLPLDPEKLNNYLVFSSALNLLVEQLHLTGKMNYLQIRKFGWLYAESVLKESE